MAAGDWLLGCIPLQETDTGLFNRAYYLSGYYGLWRPILTVGLGAIGGFLYYFVVKALNADIDEKYRKIKNVQLCAQPRVCSLTGGNPVYPRSNQPDISESWDGTSNGI